MNFNPMDPEIDCYRNRSGFVNRSWHCPVHKKTQKHQAELRDRFGPEYDRAVRQHGSEREAEAK